eukprot:TRINITY_DN24995_c0_g1_i1.p1 TRINITY_DN24995_c0_g1~~TRINITY_DN24995_c0_g1_i1.p1  ORF type:complete len:204 (-),score=30.14 TRINITY_DN24995_c0_g1_i1:10-621(-)
MLHTVYCLFIDPMTFSDFGLFLCFFLISRRPPRSTLSSSSAASDVYKRQTLPYVPTLWSRHKIALIGAKKQHCSSGGCDHSSCGATHHSGIATFVYSRRDRRFDAIKLQATLIELMPVDMISLEWCEEQIQGGEGGATGLLRSKGFLQLDGDERRFYWSHAGRQLLLSGCPGAKEHRGVELVFIGSNMPRELIEESLDRCLAH